MIFFLKFYLAIFIILCLALGCENNKNKTQENLNTEHLNQKHKHKHNHKIKQANAGVPHGEENIIDNNILFVPSSDNPFKQYFLPGKYLHGSPAAGRIENDLYRFYKGDTLKLEYYRPTNGYAILIGTMAWKNDSTILVKWDTGYKDYNFEKGGKLKKVKLELLKLSIPKVDDQENYPPLVIMNDNPYWTNFDN